MRQTTDTRALPTGRQMTVHVAPGERLPAPWRGLRAAAVLLRANARQIVLGLLVLCLLAASVFQLYRLAALYPGHSLRYGVPIAPGAAEGALAHAAENPEKGLWPTFWREERLPLKSELAGGSFRCFAYSGDGSLVWPARFLAGGWPGATDAGGCAVSAALAWQLWGSYDVVGKTLEADGKTLTLRGVFAGEEPLCLVQTDAGAGGGWQAAEFPRTPDATTADIEAFATASGLGAPDVLLSGGGILAKGAALCVFSLLLPTMFLFGRWARAARRHSRLPFGPFVAAGLIVFALCLPGLLQHLPADFLPSRWSDFSHWGNLWRQAADSLDTFLAMAPGPRDVAAKKALLLLGGGCLLACPLGFWFAAGLPLGKK